MNARKIEDALQQRFQHLVLGRRLWRENDRGAKYDRERDVGKVHKVLLTYTLPGAYPNVLDGSIRVNP